MRMVVFIATGRGVPLRPCILITYSENLYINHLNITEIKNINT
jgi:hypothetical protein